MGRRPAPQASNLWMRADALAAIRAFFRGRGYLEVETPTRVRWPALEDHIDPVASGEAWLRTSPELHMKRMLCEGYERIYQIGPCFRRGEVGRRHLPEYQMLEWYRVGVDSSFLVEETLALLRVAAEATGGTARGGVDVAADPMVISVRDAFWLWAGWDPVEAFDEDRFDLDLAEKVEPRLAEQPVPVVVKDFPAARSALARLRPGMPPVADRWELYLGGMELANAYTELTDPGEQRRRFEVCREARRGRGQEVWAVDEAFMAALGRGMPDCAGIALGVDRLAMWLCGAEDIREVTAFGDDVGDRG